MFCILLKYSCFDFIKIFLFCISLSNSCYLFLIPYTFRSVKIIKLFHLLICFAFSWPCFSSLEFFTSKLFLCIRHWPAAQSRGTWVICSLLFFPLAFDDQAHPSRLQYSNFDAESHYSGVLMGMLLCHFHTSSPTCESLGLQ